MKIPVAMKTPASTYASHTGSIKAIGSGGPKLPMTISPEIISSMAIADSKGASDALSIAFFMLPTSLIHFDVAGACADDDACPSAYAYSVEAYRAFYDRESTRGTLREPYRRIPHRHNLARLKPRREYQRSHYGATGTVLP